MTKEQMKDFVPQCRVVDNGVIRQCEYDEIPENVEYESVCTNYWLPTETPLRHILKKEYVTYRINNDLLPKNKGITNSDFMNFVKNIQTKEFELMDVKGSEYSTMDNRLHNFELAKKLYDLIENKDSEYFPYFANFCKQFVGIIDILNGKKYDSGLVNEKFGDSRNYLLLLQAKLLKDIE